MYYYKPVDCSLLNAKPCNTATIISKLKRLFILHSVYFGVSCEEKNEQMHFIYTSMTDRLVFLNDTLLVMKLELFLYPF